MNYLNHIKDETPRMNNLAKPRCALDCSSPSHHLFYIIQERIFKNRRQVKKKFNEQKKSTQIQMFHNELPITCLFHSKQNKQNSKNNKILDIFSSSSSYIAQVSVLSVC